MQKKLFTSLQTSLPHWKCSNVPMLHDTCEISFTNELATHITHEQTTLCGTMTMMTSKLLLLFLMIIMMMMMSYWIGNWHQWLALVCLSRCFRLDFHLSNYNGTLFLSLSLSIHVLNITDQFTLDNCVIHAGGLDVVCPGKNVPTLALFNEHTCTHTWNVFMSVDWSVTWHNRTYDRYA